MSITLPSVPPYYSDPKLDYRMAQKLQEAFQTNLSWLDRAYHIAKVGINAEAKTGYPQIHANDGSKEHFDIRADDKIGAYSFIEIEKPYVINFNDDEVRYYFSVVFWCNLDNIDALKDYDFTSELIKDVTDLLLSMEAGSVGVETRPERIFDKYSGIRQDLKQFQMRRFTSFKISFDILDLYTDNC